MTALLSLPRMPRAPVRRDLLAASCEGTLTHEVRHRARAELRAFIARGGAAPEAFTDHGIAAHMRAHSCQLPAPVCSKVSASLTRHQQRPLPHQRERIRVIARVLRDSPDFDAAGFAAALAADAPIADIIDRLYQPIRAWTKRIESAPALVEAKARLSIRPCMFFEGLDDAAETPTSEGIVSLTMDEPLVICSVAGLSEEQTALLAFAWDRLCAQVQFPTMCSAAETVEWIAPMAAEFLRDLVDSSRVENGVAIVPEQLLEQTASEWGYESIEEFTREGRFQTYVEWVHRQRERPRFDAEAMADYEKRHPACDVLRTARSLLSLADFAASAERIPDKWLKQLPAVFDEEVGIFPAMIELLPACVEDLLEQEIEGICNNYGAARVSIGTTADAPKRVIRMIQRLILDGTVAATACDLVRDCAPASARQA